MANLTRCDRCKGTKKCLSLGNFLVDCIHCKGIGYIDEEVIINPHNVIKHESSDTHRVDQVNTASTDTIACNHSISDNNNIEGLEVITEVPKIKRKRRPKIQLFPNAKTIPLEA